MQVPKLKILPFFLLLLLVFLQARLWFQAGGILDMLHMRKQLVLETQLNDKLKIRNQVLLKQVQNLQNNNSAIESRARHDLGMIKKDETFYQIVE